jgi:DNA polymerase-3 subunit delta'
MFHTHLWEQRNIPHALLLVGDDEQTLIFAQDFAHGLLCVQPKAGAACGVCKSCQLLTAQTHPDYYVLAAAGKSETIGIDVIRHVTDFCEQTPQCGDKKIIIIPKAHHMNISASNALLKTLEEPPGNSYFLLTSSIPAALPATVRSRCQVVRFPIVDNVVVPDWQSALHADCAALLSGKIDPLVMAQKWQKEDLLAVLAQMEIYFAKIRGFTGLDKINAVRKIVLQHGSVNAILQLEALLINLTTGFEINTCAS